MAESNDNPSAGEEDDYVEGIDLEDLILTHRRCPPRGIPKLPPLISFERNLTEDDFERLEDHEPCETPVHTPLQQIKFRHQMAARLVADGVPTQHIGLVTGYTPSYVEQLKLDPAFKELITFFADQKTALFADVYMKLGTLGMTAVELMQERLNDPEQAAGMGMKTLKETAEFAFERSVAPAKSRATVEAGRGEGGRTAIINLNFSEPPKGAITIESQVEKDE